MLKYGVAPTCWKVGLVFPLVKEGKDSSQPASYRPICLLSHVRKLFEKVILARIKKTVLEQLPKTQFGFCSHVSTLDAALALDEVLRSRCWTYSPTFVAFLDVKAAYDSVNREKLWAKLEGFISPEYAGVIMDLFEENVVRILSGNHTINEVKLTVGLIQESFLALLLYNVFVSDLPAAADQVNSKMQRRLGGGRMDAWMFQFADDLCLVAKSHQQMGELLNAVNSHAVENDYSFNITKSVVLARDSCQPLVLNGQLLPHQEVFKYLGVQFRLYGIDSGSHYQMLVDRAKRGSQESWWGLLRYVPLKRRAALFKAVIRSRFEYGLSLLPSKRVKSTKLDSWVYAALTKLLRVGRNVSKLGVRWCLGVESKEERRTRLAQGLANRLLVQA